MQTQITKKVVITDGVLKNKLDVPKTYKLSQAYLFNRWPIIGPLEANLVFRNKKEEEIWIRMALGKFRKMFLSDEHRGYEFSNWSLDFEPDDNHNLSIMMER
jgi:hypothetical protein